jgi:N-acyl-L-homoserine lactone synthetase
MKRAYYSKSIKQFLHDSDSSVLGKLTSSHTNRNLEDLQINAWKSQIQILKNQLKGLDGKVYFEFAIPRMGKRVDNIIIINDVIFIVEFKVGSGGYEKHAIEQVVDYTIDLKNFHEGSHNIRLVPVLISTNAKDVEEDISDVLKFNSAEKTNQSNLKNAFQKYVNYSEKGIDIEYWESSIYKPTPTIVEAAQALYKGHNVKEITRSDSGAINLTTTTDCINDVIECSKANNLKSICFVTGVPGAGKTLAGLNIAVERMNVDEDEHAVFLSGNGPLVDVLREALARDNVANSKKNGQNLTKKQASIKANAFIQNIHHFRDDNLQSDNAPIEKVVVFDESQRAWTKQQTSSFMKRKKGIDDFDKSEPEFLISVMDRHNDWCTIVCLIGGGQEINTGEAGLEEWISSLKQNFPIWNIYYSKLIIESDNYLKDSYIKKWLPEAGNSKEELHLSVSVRSFRAEKLSAFIHELLNMNIKIAQGIYKEVKGTYPIAITRNLNTAKNWLREKAKGTERIGLISSSGARRLRPFGVDVKNEISAPNWFLNDNSDIRSSYFLEEVATEFDVQGLEIDWACVAWGANFHINGSDWKCQSFKGSKWQNINKEIDKEYLKNTYRVLLTRARQGMVIFIPNGSDIDQTRPAKFYDETYRYLKEIGITEI